MATPSYLVSEKFQEASDYAETAWTLAEGFISALSDAAEVTELDETVLNYTFVPLTSDLQSVMPPADPVFGEISNDTPNAPISNVPVLNTVTIPTKSYGTLTIDEPTKPSVTDPTDPGDPQSLNEVTLPDKPSFVYPRAPTLGTHTLPIKPTINMPQFTGIIPIDDIRIPENTFNYMEVVYQSELLDAVKIKLAVDLAAGGTGLGAEAEAAIWARARDRQAELDEKLIDQTLEFFASRGWNMPNGAMMARLSEAHNESRRSSEKLNNDILVQQSQLAYQNIKDTITSIIGLEQALIQHADTVANRGLEAAKYTVEAAINIVNAQIAKLGAALERYKAIATVYEVESRVQMLLIDMYGKELSAVELLSNIDMMGVERYKALLSAIQVQASVYETEMKGAALEADFESKKLENFKLLIDIFTAKINANTQKYNQYQAEWQGQAIKASAHGESVKAFSVEMQGAGIQSDINKTIADISASINDSRSKNYSVAVEAYKAHLQGVLALIEAESKEYAVKGGMYEADARVAVGKAEMNLKANEANLRMLMAQLELELKQAEVNIANAQQTNQLRLEAAKTGADVTSRMASASLSSINASASLGDSQTQSWDNTKDVHTYSHNMSSECNECD